MSLNEEITNNLLDLIHTYTVSKGRKRKKVGVLHVDFKKLPRNTRRLIEDVLKEVYRDDFEIVRKAFVEKSDMMLKKLKNEVKLVFRQMNMRFFR